MARAWRVMPRTDALGNQLWSLQYETIWRDGSRYGLWREESVFRDEGRALAELARRRTPCPHEHEHEGNVFMCPHWIDEPHEHTPTEEE
ncbi:hypothetical protein I5J47_gp65 [Mycobacterium phage Arib1]|uniref:Uncharacterized protein n=2 Tax=Fishburnevirus TaxID=1983734 RepID=A0A143FQ30_9CAUD|nr:hypothetical protein SEA_SHIPWRECK_69 [Mycobacterium phage Shipwreck]YP_009964715.1 hypothetical protein I5J44_gp67 [Mycobacterium phage Phineas]YP_009964949.1 hypothetical protein I5J47_gp65 [Mycobacterium phage Arib1]ASD53705.1 hypothetical protein SEA_BOGIE_69 [Mycobacterium phage Bogie]QDH85025.1 hypothetical protein SEA_HUHILLTOP_69 [Mycobacterium phage HUHilltop]UYL87591.1 hypothetical protein SEA_DYNAMO_66 [Mycobacterium phage Dynamo]AMW63888.1 hypothetical protein SEA_SHIPWRECK_69 